MTTLQSSPKIVKTSWLSHLRLIGTLAAKDIVDAVKTKSTLTAIVISFLMVFFYRYFPALATSSDTLDVLVYAETDSPVVTALERSPALAVYTYDSRQRLMDIFSDAEDVELAVIIPETAVSPQNSSTPITIEGHVMYWLSADQRAEIKTLIEDDLTAQLGQPVTLNLTGNDVFFNADTFFFAFSATTALVFIAVMIGLSLVSNLMVEEKQTKTLDALLVSPASATDLVAGKALAGLFYGLVGSAIVLIVFSYLIIQWPLAILAAVLGTLFMVAVGLLLGIYVEARPQLQLISWFIVVPLLIPVVLVALEGLVPTGAIAVMNWIPTVLVAKIFRLSLTPNATFAHYAAELAVLVIATLLLLGLVVVLVRRQDRQ